MNFECIYFWCVDFSFWILNVFDERMIWNWEKKSVCNPEQEFYQIIIIKMFRQTLAHIKLLSKTKLELSNTFLYKDVKLRFNEGYKDSMRVETALSNCIAYGQCRFIGAYWSCQWYGWFVCLVYWTPSKEWRKAITQ